MEQSDIQNLIDQSIAKYALLSNTKYGDTPTDALQLVPKQYADTKVPIPVGITNGDVIIADNTQSSGINWVAPYDYQEFTASANWTKPVVATANSLVYIQMWGAGGGGGGATTGQPVGNAAGGGGAEYLDITMKVGDLGSTIFITIGAGGAGGVGANPGADGGASNFNSGQFSVRGGKGGERNSGAGVVAAGAGYFPGVTTGQNALDSFSGGAGTASGQPGQVGGNAFRGGSGGGCGSGSGGANAFLWLGGAGSSGNGNGQDAPNTACGGGGATQSGAGGPRTGGKGGSGYCRIWTIYT